MRREALLEAAGAGPGDASAGSRGRRGAPPEARAGIPPEPVPYFVGRDAELLEVHRLLQRDRRLAVHGLGGVGKTQLALRYVHDRASEYPDGVYWLRADRESAVVGDLASLAWRLRLAERDAPEQERQIEAVNHWLRQHPRWLLVLDNLEPEAREAVRRCLPPGLPGHLLTTSRTRTWLVRFDLQPLNMEQAVDFLLQRTGQRDSQAAETVARTLGCLPLALEQAAGYMEGSGRELTSYAALLQTRLVDLMEQGKPEDYPRPVVSTWQLSFERVEDEQPAAAGLLRLCAFLAPDEIPVSLFQTGAGRLSDELRQVLADDVALDRTIVALRQYSLLERQGDRLWMHRLVQAVVRESLAVPQRESWHAAAIRLLRAAYPDEPEHHPERWPLCERLLPHVLVGAKLTGDPVPEPLALGWLLDRAGCYLCARGELGLAAELLERALVLRERHGEGDDCEVAQSLNNLGVLLMSRGQLAAARSRLERALTIRERLLGPEHPDTASSLNSLAFLLREQGDAAAARPLQERAVAVWERTLGLDSPSTANALNNLAALMLDQGDLQAARSLFERALSVRERALGPVHPDTAQSLNNLGLLLRRLGKLAAAERLLRRALAIREEMLGHRHRNTARTRHHLALVLRDRGDVEGARPLFESALDVLEHALGPGHRWTIESRRCLRG